MKLIASLILGASVAFLTQSAYAYNVEKYGKESRSTIYKVSCSSGKSYLVRHENSGKWCSGSSCYGSLDALMRNSFSSCR